MPMPLLPVSVVALLVTRVVSQCSAPSLSASYPAPSVASGYTARLVANGLQSPRSIKFDSEGRLLVVQQGLGIQALTFTDGGGDCISMSKKEDVVKDENVSFGSFYFSWWREKNIEAE